MTKSIGVIVINKGVRNKAFNSESIELRRARATQRMKQIWQVDEVKLIEDGSKSQIVATFDNLMK